MIKEIFGVALAAALLGAGAPAFANDGLADGFPPAQSLNYTHMPGPDMAADGTTAPAGAPDGEYLFLAGSAFTPRTSGQTVTYSGAGCIHSTTAVTTSLELPQDATVMGVRLYYYNLDSPNDVTLYLTTYPGDGSSADRLVGSSSLDTGYSSEYMLLATPLSIENFGQAHVLTALMEPATSLCGMRVFYAL